TIVVGLTTGLQTGDAVLYNAEGHSAIGGLTSGSTYFVNVQGNGTIRLYSTEADAVAGNASFIALTSTGGGVEQMLTFSPSIHFTPAAPSVVDTLNSEILLPAQNGLSTGDAVVYDAGPGNSAIGGLTSGNTYYVSLRANGTIRLYDSQSDANNDAGNFKVLSSKGSGDQKFITADSATVKFDPNGTTN